MATNKERLTWARRRLLHFISFWHRLLVPIVPMLARKERRHRGRQKLIVLRRGRRRVAHAAVVAVGAHRRLPHVGRRVAEAAVVLQLPAGRVLRVPACPKNTASGSHRLERDFCSHLCAHRARLHPDREPCLLRVGPEGANVHALLVERRVVVAPDGPTPVVIAAHVLAIRRIPAIHGSVRLELVLVRIACYGRT